MPNPFSVLSDGSSSPETSRANSPEPADGTQFAAALPLAKPAADASFKTVANARRRPPVQKQFTGVDRNQRERSFALRLDPDWNKHSAGSQPNHESLAYGEREVKQLAADGLAMAVGDHGPKHNNAVLDPDTAAFSYFLASADKNQQTVPNVTISKGIHQFQTPSGSKMMPHITLEANAKRYDHETRQWLSRNITMHLWLDIVPDAVPGRLAYQPAALTIKPRTGVDIPAAVIPATSMSSSRNVFHPRVSVAADAEQRAAAQLQGSRRGSISSASTDRKPLLP